MPPPDPTSETKPELSNAAGETQPPVSDKNFYTWSVLFKAILRTATPQEEYQYFQQRSIANEEKDCERCESWKEWNLRNSPVVRFLREQTALVGGPDMTSSDFLCRRCPYLMAGGYSQGGARISSPSPTTSSSSTSPSFSDTPTDPDNPSSSSSTTTTTTTRRPTILLCANHLKDRSHQEDTMAHELVHAYDYARFRVSPRSLHHQACTEIRASTLSGECRVWKQFGRRNGFRVANSLQECVRRRAALSLRGRPGVDDLKAAKVVNEVFESCFRDTRPFDEIYR